MIRVTKKEIIVILNRLNYVKTLTPGGTIWEIDETGIPEFIEVEVKDE